MRLPVLKRRNNYRRRMVAFGGINLTNDFSDGEMRDLYGISHDNFPFLSQTPDLETFFECSNPTCAVNTSQMCVAADDGFYYGGKKVGEVKLGNKMIAEIGDKIVVFPDKLYYSTTDKTFLSMEGEIHISGTRVTYGDDVINIKEAVYETTTDVESIELNPEFKVFKFTDANALNGTVNLFGKTVIKAKELKTDDLFLETSARGKFRKVYSAELIENGKIKVTGEVTKAKNISEKLFEGFRVGDTVEITGSAIQKNGLEAKITGITETSLSFPAETLKAGVETADIVIKRKIPDFSCICIYENRLWGCEGKTIYASKLGDPLNFFSYSGVSTDSFSVESNSAGDFTAISTYGNCCLIFKENKCYKLYGNKPSNFRLSECFGAGISENDKNSIAVFEGQMFYRGTGGVYSFFGGIPECISLKLGNNLPENCVGGAFGHCYYLSGDIDGKRLEYVYDLKSRLWSKSGVEGVIGYLSTGDKLYRFKENGIETVCENEKHSREWYAEFCPFSENYHKEKKYSRLFITANMEEGSWLKAEIRRDGGLWETVGIKHSTKKEYISIPCMVKNCHELSLRLSGKGKSVIESVIREFSVH